jgi:hypothetical protein
MVAARDVDLPSVTGRHRVVDGKRQVGHLAPRVPGGRIGIDARGVLPIGREAADDVDLAASECRGHLAACERQRRATSPLRGPACRYCRKE